MLEMPGAVADYTLGTIIVLFHVRVRARTRS